MAEWATLDPCTLSQYLYTRIPWDIYFSDIIKVDASPGFPWLLLGKTNKILVRDYKQVLIDVTIDRLVKLLTWDINYILTLTPQQLMDYNLVDPVRLFVKNEPHASSKFKTGKMRLISSVSIIDQLIERLLHSRINEYLIMDWKAIPSKPGIGLNTDADFSAIADQYKQIQNPCSSDIKGWDWSVQYDELVYVAELRAHMYQLPTDHPFMRAICTRQHLVATSIYGLSDGTLFYSPTEIGVQLSGCYLTSAGNSEMRIANTINAAAINNIALTLDEGDDNTTIAKAIAMYNLDPQKYLDQLPYCYNMAMGDDCIEDYYDPNNRNLLGTIYAHLGHPVKFVSKMEKNERGYHSFEFCSHQVILTGERDYRKHWPVNVGKTMYTLSHQPASRRTLETLDQFLVSVRHHPEYQEISTHLCKDPLWRDVILEYIENKSANYKLEYTQSCLSEMTRKGSSKKVIVDDIGNQQVIIKKKKSTTAHPPQKDTEVLEYITPYARHLKLGNTRVTKTIHKDKQSASGTTPLSRSIQYGKESFKLTAIENGIKIKGRSIVSQLVTHYTSTLAQLNTCVLMHPSAMNSVQLDLFSKLYQKFKFKKFSLEAVSQLPATATGMVFGAVYPSNDIVPPLESLNLKKYLQANPTFRETNVYKPLHISMPSSRYLPSYTMEFGTSDTSIQGVAYLGSQYATGSQYIADIIVSYEIELYNMTAPAVFNSTPSQVVIDFATSSLPSFYKAESAQPYHPTGIYQMVCQLGPDIRGASTRNGPNLAQNTQVLWYVCKRIDESSWTHTWHYTYDAAVANEYIKFEPNVNIATTSYVRMWGNLVRRFGEDAEQPYNTKPKLNYEAINNIVEKADIQDSSTLDTTMAYSAEPTRDQRLAAIRYEISKLQGLN